MNLVPEAFHAVFRGFWFAFCSHQKHKLFCVALSFINAQRDQKFRLPAGRDCRLFFLSCSLLTFPFLFPTRLNQRQRLNRRNRVPAVDCENTGAERNRNHSRGRWSDTGLGCRFSVRMIAIDFLSRLEVVSTDWIPPAECSIEITTATSPSMSSSGRCKWSARMSPMLNWTRCSS